MDSFIAKSIIILAALLSFSHARPTLSRKERAAIEKRAIEETHPEDNFLRQYGYLTDFPVDSEKVAIETDRKAALRSFQEYFGLEVSGILDYSSNILMNAERCGCPDKTPDWKSPGSTSFTVGVNEQKWTTTLNVTWRIVTPYVNNSAITLELQRSEMRRAFGIWSEVANIHFTEVTEGQSNIAIDFASGVHNIGDFDGDFDGPGRVLAHAFFPEDGRVHFDSDEAWVISWFVGIDLFTVAAHEIGHAIGLGHSTVDDALMYPYYKGYDPMFKLDADDIAGAQYLYGPALTTTTSTSTSTSTSTTSTAASTTQPSAQTPTTQSQGTSGGTTYKTKHWLLMMIQTYIIFVILNI